MIALHFQPDQNRHIVRLPYIVDIEGKVCIKEYATEYACVYQAYDEDGLFYVYAITRVGYAEEFGALLSTQGDLYGAMDIAGKELAPG
jgi:hypothetical protein